MWLEVLNTTTKIPTLQQHLFYSLKAIRRKQHDMFAQGLDGWSIQMTNICSQ
jgi:hypothetical protein